MKRTLVVVGLTLLMSIGSGAPASADPGANVHNCNGVNASSGTLKEMLAFLEPGMKDEYVRQGGRSSLGANCSDNNGVGGHDPAP